LLTRRENLLAALSHAQAEHLAAFFVADNFNQPWPLPARLREDPFDLGIMRFLGGDVVDRLAFTSLVTREAPAVDYTETRSDGRLQSTWQTAQGALTKIAQASPEGETTFVTEFPIKGLHDYAILCAMLEGTRLSVNEQAVQDAPARQSRVGDDGITYTVCPAAPIMDVTRQWTGLERCVYDLCDHPQVVEDLLERMHALNCAQYTLTAQHTPGRVIVCWDDMNSLYLSRAQARRYWLPAIRDYAEICHRYGKLFVVHTCGKLQGLLDLFPEASVDAIDWLTPPPTGDVGFAEAQRRCGERIAIMGAAEPGVLRFGSPDEVEAAVRRWLEGVNVRYNFVLMIPCPVGTPLANAARVAKVLARDYGFPLNRDPEQGALWQDPHAHW
jgi:hypothetical protein